MRGYQVDWGALIAEPIEGVKYSSIRDFMVEYYERRELGGTIIGKKLGGIPGATVIDKVRSLGIKVRKRGGYNLREHRVKEVLSVSDTNKVTCEELAAKCKRSSSNISRVCDKNNVPFKRAKNEPKERQEALEKRRNRRELFAGMGDWVYVPANTCNYDEGME